MNSVGDAGCVAEWSKAEHEAVEALLVAHMSGEKASLESLELREEVLHDCTEVSQDEPVSTEWADYSNIAPLGAASRAFLESVFSKSVAAVLQENRNQDDSINRRNYTETELTAGEDQDTPQPGTQDIEGPTTRQPTPPRTLRHFADYKSKTDLPLRISGVSEEELRHFNSIGLPVQMEGMPRLVRLKGAPQLLQKKQVHEHETKQKAQDNEPKEVEEPEPRKDVCLLDDSQVALLQDLTSVDGNDLSLEDLKNALASGKGETTPVFTPPVDPDPQLERQPVPAQEIATEPELKPALEQKWKLDPHPETHAKLEPEPDPEWWKPAQDGEHDEGSTDVKAGTEKPTPVPEVQLAPPVESSTDAESILQKKGSGRPSPRLIRHSGNFRTRVFYSLCEETPKQRNPKSFRRSIMIKGVGSVVVRHFADFTSSHLPQISKWTGAAHSHAPNFGCLLTLRAISGDTVEQHDHAYSFACNYTVQPFWFLLEVLIFFLQGEVVSQKTNLPPKLRPFPLNSVRKRTVRHRCFERNSH